MLIIDMPMPRNCQECPLLHALYLYGSKYCRANGIAYEKEHYKLKRPDQCPIVGELPDEHGDLVDRDEVKQKMIHYGFRAIDMTATEFCEDELQTVIAAERRARSDG